MGRRIRGALLSPLLPFFFFLFSSLFPVPPLSAVVLLPFLLPPSFPFLLSSLFSFLPFFSLLSCRSFFFFSLLFPSFPSLLFSLFSLFSPFSLFSYPSLSLPLSSLPFASLFFWPSFWLRGARSRA